MKYLDVLAHSTLYRFVILIFLLLLAISGLTGMGSSFILRQTMKAEILLEARNLVHPLANVAYTADSLEVVQRLTAVIGVGQQVEWIAVVNLESDRVVACSRLEWIGWNLAQLEIREPTGLIIDRQGVGIGPAALQTRGEYGFVTQYFSSSLLALSSGPMGRGLIIAKLRLTNASQAIRHLQECLLGLALASILIFLGCFGLIFKRQVMNPIDAITRVLLAPIDETRTTLRMPTQVSREFGKITDAYNRMVDALAQSQSAIRAGELRYQASLEEAVRSRTAALAESEALFRNVFEHHSAIKLNIDLETGCILAANRAAARYYGWTQEELSRMRIQDINVLPPDVIQAEMLKVVSLGQDYFEFKHRRADGSIRDVAVYSGNIATQGRPVLHSIVHDITDKKRAEKQLMDSEIRVRAILNAIPDLIFVISREGVYLDCMASDAEFLLQAPHQFIGQPISAVHSSQLAAKFMEAIDAALTTRRIQINEYSLVMEGRGLRWFEARIIAMDADRVLATVRDITDRKVAESELLQFKQIIDSATFGLSLSDLAGRLIYCNAYMAEAHGYGVDEVRNANIRLFHSERAWAQVEALIGQIQRDEHFLAEEVFHRHRSGHEFSMLMNGMLFRDEQGVPLFMAVTAIDISDRKRLENSLRESHAELELRVAERTAELAAEIKKNQQALVSLGESESYNRALLAAIPDLIFMIDRGGHFIGHHAAPGQELMLSPDLFLNRAAEQILPPPVAFQLRQALAALFAGNDNQHFEYNLLIGGSTQWYDALVTKLNDDTAMLVARNITDRKQRELENRRQSGLIAALLDSIPDLIFLKDVNGVYLGCNPTFSEFVGRSRDEIIGRTDEDLFGSVVAAEFRRNDRLMLEQLKIRHNDEWITYPDGRKILVDTLKTPYRGLDGELLGLLGISRNITDRYLAQEQLHQINMNLKKAIDLANDQALKAEAASRAKSDFVASMSHELRTPLNAVIGFAQVLASRHFGALTSKQDAYVRYIVEGGRHLLDLINDILDLSKVEAGKMTLDLVPIVIADLIADSLIMIREKCLTHRIDLFLDIDPVLKGVDIQADARKVKQILYNLLSNAAKFTPAGGTIRVRAVRIFRGPSPWVEVAITDSGIGIKPEFQSKIFDPFYQIHGGIDSKTPGTGLGLTLTRQLIILHGGELTVESAGENQGCCATFRLPFEAIARVLVDTD